MNFQKITPVIFIALFFTNLLHANYTKNLFPTKSGGLSIDSPTQGTTVTGDNLTISGTSTHPDCILRLLLNDTLIGSTQTEGDGSWSFNGLELPDNNYAVKAEIYGTSGSEFGILASATSDFNVVNNPRISVTTPIANEVNQIYYTNISGNTTLSPLSPVRISIDSNIITTTTTNEAGDWEYDFPALENGEHTLFVELLSEGVPIATQTVVFLSLSPTMICNNGQLGLVQGTVPTSGSGTGNGFSYSVAGATVAITFDSAFPSIPTAIATGQYSSGSSTVTITSINESSCQITFSGGTEKVHFLVLYCFF